MKYLNENLNTKNVLKIYSHARLYALGDIEKEFEPSAPEAPTENCDLYKPTLCYPSMMNDQGGSCRKSDGDDKSLQTNSIPFWSNALIYNCLQHIDENADEVLSQEGIEDLNAENLKEIIKRDTLKIKSEYVVFLALDRWSNRECMRQQLNLNPENRRFVLKDLIYEIRFPFFFPDEFLMGPIQGGWLDQQELAVFSAMISNVKSKEQVPHWWKPHLDKILRKRIYTKHESVNLRQRTYTIESAKWQEKDFKKNLIFKKIKKKNKSAAKERNSISFSENKERSCAGCFRDFLVDVLISIFD